MRLLFTLFFIIFSFAARANNTTLKIAVADFPPFEFYEDNKLQGVNPKTIQDVLKKIGYDADFIPLPWKRALNALQKGEVDAIASMPKTSSTENMFIFSKPIMYSNFALLKNKDLNISPKSYSDLKPYNIGVIDEYFYNQEFESADTFLNFTPITSPTPDVDNLQKLAHGRIDLMACSEHVCKYWMAKYPNLFTNIEFVSSLSIDDGHTLHLAFAKNKPEFANQILAKFNPALEEYINEGNIEKNIAMYPNSGLDSSSFDKKKLLQ